MLRTLGIPSRVVTGFQSGVYNPMTGWQVIRASDAHSWVEAWIEGRGWTTFDPTPFDTSGGEQGLMSRLALLSDAASQVLNDWVMNYDQDHQAELLARAQDARRRFRLPDFDEVAAGFTDAGRAGLRYLPVMGGSIAIVVLWLFFGPAVLRWWRHRARVRKVEGGAGDPSDATILYQQMLEDAVAELKTKGAEEVLSDRGWSPQINTGAAVLIPEDYVPDLTVRLALYRRLSDAERAEDREALAAELIDRFGPLPPEAGQLLQVVAIKGLCREANVAKIDVGPKGAVASFRADTFANPMALVQFVQRNQAVWRVRPDQKVVIKGEWETPKARLEAAERLLTQLAKLAKGEGDVGCFYRSLAYLTSVLHGA
jgi:hypothetical protein